MKVKAKKTKKAKVIKAPSSSDASLSRIESKIDTIMSIVKEHVVANKILPAIKGPSWPK